MDEEIDLKRTPQQRPSKRKEHRLKVTIEGKAKRTKTSQNPEKQNTMAGNPSRKRKYVQKKGLKETPMAPQAEDTRESGDANKGNAIKSARRALNFELEVAATEARTVLGRMERTTQSDQADLVNIVSNPQTTEPSTTNNILSGATRTSISEGTPISEVTQQYMFPPPPQYQQTNLHDITSTSKDQSSGPYCSLSKLQAAVRQQGTINHRQLGGDFSLISGHSEWPLGVGVGRPNSFIGQNSPSEQHGSNAGVRQAMLQPKANLENLTNSRQVLLNRFSQAALNMARGEHSFLNGQTHQSISSKVMWQHILSTLSEAQRKTNVQERPSRVSLLAEDSRQDHFRHPYSDMASRILAAQKNDEMSRSYAINEVNQFLSNGNLQSIALCQRQVLFGQQACSIREESGVLSQKNQRDSVTGVENHCSLQLIRASPNVPANKQSKRVSAVMTPMPSKLQKIQKRRTSPQPAAEARGATTTMKQTGLSMIDEITHQLSNVHLGGEESAIVP